MERCGIENKTGPVLRSCRMGLRKTIRCIWQTVGRVFCWVMAACVMGARIFLRPITRRTFGEESILLRECSTLTIPAITVIAVRWWCLLYARMWNFESSLSWDIRHPLFWDTQGILNASCPCECPPNKQVLGAVRKCP